jgi:hypothetical protein
MPKPSYLNRELVRRLSKEYHMPESDIRQMLAIEEGYSNGDIKDTSKAELRMGWFSRLIAYLF